MIPIAITNDLRNGMGLEEALVKHNTNLHELFKPNERKVPSPQIDDWAFIQPTPYNTFRVSKQRNGRKIECGTYKNHEDAIRVRDEMLLVDWDKSQLPGILEKFGIQKGKRGGNRR